MSPSRKSSSCMLISPGFKSYLSICSEPGIKWVTAQIADSSFRGIATTFMKDVARLLKTNKRLSPNRVPEPEAEWAWRYTKGIYFRPFLPAPFTPRSDINENSWQRILNSPSTRR